MSGRNPLFGKQVTRRTVLAGTAGLVGAALVAGPAGAEGSLPIDGSTLPTFGPASETAAIVSMRVYGNSAYVVTRGVTPAPIVEIDLTTRQVVRTADLPSGDGAWAMTVAGDRIYVGMYADASVHWFEPATGAIGTVGRLGTNTFVWDLVTAPDGMIFAVTYPDGAVWQIDPATDVATKLGSPVPGAQYGRYLTADENRVYAGIYTPARLMAYERATGAWQDLTPAEAGGGAFGPFALAGDRLYACTAAGLITMARDGSGVQVVPKPSSESSLDAITVGPDGTAYVTTRRSGSVWSAVPGAAEMTRLAAPPNADEHRGLALLGRTLLGGAGSGALWWLDLDTGAYEYLDLIDAGLAVAPDKPQSMLLVDDQLYVGGHFVITKHDVRSWSKVRIRVPGEAKTLSRVGDQLYSGIYPSTELVKVDLATNEVQNLGSIGHGQQRPWQSVYDRETGLLLVTSAPGTGYLVGALTVLDVTTGTYEVYPNLLPDQSIVTVDVVDGIAYLGGDVIGGGGITPTQSSASIGAFDLGSRRLLWHDQPFTGHRSIQSLVVHRGIAYVIMKRNSGSWFGYDLERRRIVVDGTGQLSGYGDVLVSRGSVYVETNFGGNVYRLGPGLTQAQHLVNKLGDEWYTVPKLCPVPGSRSQAWGLSGRQITRIPLS